MTAAPGRRRRVPLSTKRLVVHRPDGRRPTAVDDAAFGPRDGIPVWLAAPCARLRAGYLCECGLGFDFDPHSAADWDFARVEAREDGAAPWYQEEDWVIAGPVHGWATETDQAALVRQVEALPFGTVVERFGIGVAPVFAEPEEPWTRGPSWSAPYETPF